MTPLHEINSRFNEQLRRQAQGLLPGGYVYKLGRPGGILQSAGIPDLPIEMASARLLHKSNQENHPFNLSEVENLPRAIQNPLAVFRSATHIGSNVILTELRQGDKNFVVALQTNRQEGKVLVNSVRSVHYRSSNLHIVNWINAGLADYLKPISMEIWLEDLRKELHSKPQYNSADVRMKLSSCAKVIQNFKNPEIVVRQHKVKRVRGRGL
ncbi:MAG: hypothetical protein NC048_02620 [Bacteroides sp.]|nr:hypothetical protein [Bacteroides sp.]MCM1531467.1 hypothetical protein [Ruminococcus flavefaciens]MCM1554371.1 hypothetical protein [Bacteroides sp.]